uniref:Methyltransf_2 domain-containing protein n=1 Tax=Panagrellus redivivus TaxID=6233 RepID=A0A7E4VSQ3_PANRE
MESFTGDERKFFIPSVQPNFTYNMMTLGVGHNVQAEVSIMKKYPTCLKYVAVDPSDEINEKLVTDVGGTFLQYAVGAESGIAPANLMGIL